VGAKVATPILAGAAVVAALQSRRHPEVDTEKVGTEGRLVETVAMVATEPARTPRPMVLGAMVERAATVQTTTRAERVPAVSAAKAGRCTSRTVRASPSLGKTSDTLRLSALPGPAPKASGGARVLLTEVPGPAEEDSVVVAPVDRVESPTPVVAQGVVARTHPRPPYLPKHSPRRATPPLTARCTSRSYSAESLNRGVVASLFASGRTNYDSRAPSRPTTCGRASTLPHRRSFLNVSGCVASDEEPEVPGSPGRKRVPREYAPKFQANC